MVELPIKICASLACTDLLHLGRDLRALEGAGIDYLHIDVMDGALVPNFALSPDVMRAVRRATDLPMDVHLMIERPEQHLEAFVEAGADILIVHQEASVHLQRALGCIRGLRARAGVALSPSTPLHNVEHVLEDIDLLLVMTVKPGFAGQSLVPGSLRKVADARRMFSHRGLSVDIAVDGNVSFENVARMVRSGANFLVGGTSSIFHPACTIAEGVRRLRDLAERARQGRPA
jgi:ribulose-phosphate 3-epimerase